METEAKTWRGCEDLARYKGRGFTLILRKVACGKPNCTKCPHGPYWYYCYARRGKPVTVYVGRSWRNGGCLKSADVRGLLVSFASERGLLEDAREQARLLSAGAE